MWTSVRNTAHRAKKISTTGKLFDLSSYSFEQMPALPEFQSLHPPYSIVDVNSAFRHLAGRYVTRDGILVYIDSETSVAIIRPTVSGSWTVEDVSNHNVYLIVGTSKQTIKAIEVYNTSQKIVTWWKDQTRQAKGKSLD